MHFFLSFFVLLFPIALLLHTIYKKRKKQKFLMKSSKEMAQNIPLSYISVQIALSLCDSCSHFSTQKNSLFVHKSEAMTRD